MFEVQSQVEAAPMTCAGAAEPEVRQQRAAAAGLVQLLESADAERGVDVHPHLLRQLQRHSAGRTLAGQGLRVRVSGSGVGVRVGAGLILD